jgi:hypothetical protein
MSRASELGTILVEPEAAWAEAVTTMTYALATIGAVDLSGIRHPRTPSERTVQDLQEGTMPLLGVHEVEFKTKHYLPGHGSAAATALTDIMRLLGYVLGNATAGIASQTATGTGTAVAPGTSGVNGGIAGAIAWVGTKNDGRADGQPGVIATHVGSVITFLNALPAHSGEQRCARVRRVRVPVGVAAQAAVQSLRFRLQTANLQVVAHGCFPRSIRFDFPMSGKPTFEVTWGGSWYEFVAATYPDVTAKQDYLAAPIAAGSFFNQTVAVTTRDAAHVKQIETFSLTYDLGISPKMGPGGVSPYQKYISADRTPGHCSIEYTLDSEAATATPTEGGSDTVFEHALFNLNGAAPGQRVAIYFPKLCRRENNALQIAQNGRNSKRVVMDAYTGGTSTSELTKSCFRIAFG